MGIEYCAIAAMSVHPDSYGIMGNKGALPWNIPDDLAYFKRITGRCPIIMGRTTWESLPKKPLPNRMNIILSRSMASGIWMKDEPFWAPSLEEAEYHLSHHGIRKVFVIGGRGIFDLYWDKITSIYLTGIQTKRKVVGDVSFPWANINRNVWTLGSSVTEGVCTFNVWNRAAQNATMVART